MLTDWELWDKAVNHKINYFRIVPQTLSEYLPQALWEVIHFRGSKIDFDLMEVIHFCGSNIELSLWEVIHLCGPNID